MKRWAFLAIILWSTGVTAASDAPTGFSDVPWGTPSFKVSDAMSGRCVFRRISPEVAACRKYEIPTLGEVDVFFTSTPSLTGGPADGVLDGYSIDAEWGLYKGLRELALEKFGAVTQRGSNEGREVLVWNWPPIGPLKFKAVLIENCGASKSCLRVNTARRAAIEEEALKQAKEKARKSF
jgi:hypothetical protein